MAKQKKPLYDPETGIHRAKLWEIALYALNNSSTNIYMMAFMYVTYFLTGFCGVGVVLAGTITTIMRIWDGVTDPFVGMIVDKTNTKFGKNRPFIIIGNVILFVTSGIIYHVTPNLPMAARFPFYIVMYMLYIIGYTCQCVVTKSAQSCLTNDPEQRPYFTIFDSAYNTIIFAVLPVYVTGTLMPKYGGAAAFTTAAFFQELWLFCGIISAIAACMAVIALRRKDRTEFFGTGQAQKIGFKDYVDVISHNRAIQMLVVNASTDKLASSMMSSSVIMVMLCGIICGNYAQYGLMSAATSIPVVVGGMLVIRLVASRMGQKTGMLVGTYVSMASSIGIFLLFLLGDPKSLDVGMVNGLNFFTAAYIALYVIKGSFNAMSGGLVIPMTADCADYEVYRTGKYVPGLMGTLFSFVDKLISSLAGTFVSLMIAAIGFTTTQPTQDTPYSAGIFWVTMACFIGAPMVGWICNLVAMHFYPLSKEFMAEIQEKVAEIKRQAQTENA